VVTGEETQLVANDRLVASINPSIHSNSMRRYVPSRCTAGHEKLSYAPHQFGPACSNTCGHRGTLWRRPDSQKLWVRGGSSLLDLGHAWTLDF
jgi:hypothetical protein